MGAFPSSIQGARGDGVTRRAPDSDVDGANGPTEDVSNVNAEEIRAVDHDRGSVKDGGPDQMAKEHKDDHESKAATQPFKMARMPSTVDSLESRLGSKHKAVPAGLIIGLNGMSVPDRGARGRRGRTMDRGRVRAAMSDERDSERHGRTKARSRTDFQKKKRTPTPFPRPTGGPPGETGAALVGKNLWVFTLTVPGMASTDATKQVVPCFSCKVQSFDEADGTHCLEWDETGQFTAKARLGAKVLVLGQTRVNGDDHVRNCPYMVQ